MNRLVRRKVLVVGPGRKTRGGITSVINAYEKSGVWSSWNCIWIETHIDKNIFSKLGYFIFGLFHFLFELRNTRLVHIHLSEPPSAIRKSIFFFIARIFRIPTLLHFHAFSLETTLMSNKKWIYQYLINHADGVIVLSKEWLSVVSSLKIKSKNIYLLYNPCPKVNHVRTEKQNSILFAGTICKRKGYSDLINAFSLVSGKFGDWKLVFAGNGEIEEAKTLAMKLGIDDKIIFRGWLKNNDKDIVFNSCSIFCLPSYAEGFPMAILDAWSYGLPVITTRVGGLNDILENYKNALIPEPGDVLALAGYIEKLMGDIELRERLIQASVRLSNETFNIDKLELQLEEIYTELSN